MQRSIRSTVEMSIYSLQMPFIHLVKLSTVVWKSSQVNFIMLKTRLMMLSDLTEDTKDISIKETVDPSYILSNIRF